VTIEGYQNNLAPIMRRIGTRTVQSLKRSDITALVAWLSQEGGKRGQALGPRSVRAAMVALGQALDMAVAEGTIPANVSRGVRRPRHAAAKGTDLEHWQPAELQTFRVHADGDGWAAAWRLTLAGLTRADVMGLRWSDVDFDTGTITIRQGRVALDHSDHVDEPKSQQRRRTVPVETIQPGTIAMLRKLSAQQASERLAAGPAYADSGLVVVDALGEPVRPELYSDRFRKLCRAAGVPLIRLHRVRHSLAFCLHQLGVAPADAAALLGHTVEVHLSTYLPESGAAGINRAAEKLGQVAAD
jgi:integrase